ncbi:hypothetical protein [Brevundimonas sp.]|uniref:hypothetical protein n=1 Tax=Brevundimonas sp. TaxID=1871086 RepID=UPI002D4F995D|nr:hypothetical protein [Brevundimonas sp.]HYC99032.1 hypothetical protein [Brevundimonas sp.]
MADAKTPDAGGDAFSEFLKEAETFVASMLEDIAKAVGANDDAPLIASHGVALREQMARLVEATRGRYAGGNAASRRMADDFMKAQAGTTLARNARTTFRAGVAKGLFGDGIFAWLESNLEEIKKIILAIWDLFGDVPEWVNTLVQLIDEILKMILGLFGGILGRNRSKIMSDLSEQEVQFWNEIAARKRYVLAAAGGAAERED